ncbi:MAG: GtrA family protein [Helicobacteraceae bacterium]|nr:GtrA family protein [Helicobacteraceae bacterium]
MLNNSAIRYLLVGILNTIFGYGIIFSLMYFGLIPEIANFIGYTLGILLSYILNKYFTFKSKNSHKKDFFRFLVSMGIAYLINLAVLFYCYRILGIDKYISTIISACFYTASGYILSKIFAFRESK